MRCGNACNRAAPLLFLLLLCTSAILMFPSEQQDGTAADGNLRANPVMVPMPSPEPGDADGQATSAPPPPDGVVTGAAGGSGTQEPAGSGSNAAPRQPPSPSPQPPPSTAPAAAAQLTGCLFPDTLLVIGFGHPAQVEDVERLVAMYQPFFPLIVFTGEVYAIHPPPQGTQVHACNSNRGAQQYNCLASVLDQFTLFRGYMYVSGHGVVFPWRLLGLDANKAWLPSTEYHELPDPPLHTRLDYELYDAKKCKVRHNVAVTHLYEGRRVAWAGNADFLYVPARYRPEFVHQLRSFRPCRLVQTVAVPSAIHQVMAIHQETEVVVHGVYPKSRDDWLQEFTEDTVFVPQTGHTEGAMAAVSSAFAAHKPRGTPPLCVYNPYRPAA